MTDQDPRGIFEQADVIAAYTRAQAITDRVLVACPKAIAAEAGFNVPVAFTAAAWDDSVAWDESDSARQGVHQDEEGRLWAVLWMARLATCREGDLARGQVDVVLYRVSRTETDLKPRPIRLVMHIGPDDDNEPVITIMLPGED